MKVRKEQFLLPKVNPIIVNGAKWIQPNIKSTEIVKQCTASTLDKLGEGLPPAILAKVKPDFVLPAREILVTGHSGPPLIWQQQSGILRQALLKEGTRVLDVEALKGQSNANLVAITAVSAQQLTSLSSTSQVVKMNDCQVILSSDNLPTSWQENGKSSNIQLTSLPSMQKNDTSSFVISNNQMSLASFSNVNIIHQNQFQTITVNNRKPSLTPLTSTVLRTTVKKIPIRPIARPKARRNKPAQTKKILLKPTSSLLSQTALNNSIVPESNKVDSVAEGSKRLLLVDNSSVSEGTEPVSEVSAISQATCVDDVSLLHSDSCVIPPAPVLTSEVILPSDMEHHAAHDLLSQLSSSRVLPNMSCSQVSSVLNSLNHHQNDVGCVSKESKEQLKWEPTEFVKVESSQATVFNKTKTKHIETKFRECELNEHKCFRCSSCMFLSEKSEVVERHWVQCSRTPRRTISCLGCTNVFHSKYSLQIHLVCDHNVIVTEVQDLINLTIAANKVPKEPRRQNGADGEECVEAENTFPPVDCTLTPVSFLGDLELIQSQDDAKTQQLSTTPSFSLFSDIDLPADKEVIVTTDYSSVDTDGDSLANKDKSSENAQSYKNLRSKLKAEYGSDIKFNHRCVVERCGVRLSSEVNLHYHLSCHKPETDTLFCPECQVCFTNWPTLTLHLWREHKINMDLYSCIHCHYKTNSFSKLLNNHVKIHGDRKDYICGICNKGFKTGKQLRNHKVIHRGRKRYEVENEALEDYKCLICSRSFTDSRILKLHTKNVHNKARPYLCSFCNHTASSRSSLRMHIRQHTGEKPFSCEVCDYVTGDHNSLRRHKMRHSGRRQYQCPHCSYSCIQATTYKVHLKNKHPGLDDGLMFSCPLCSFRTVKKDNYMAHKAEHVHSLV